MAISQAMKVLTSNESTEWFTGPELIEPVRKFLYEIYLDPASNKIAQTIVKAKRYFTIEQDGLSQAWLASTVWLNCPYGKDDGRSSQGVWSERMRQEYHAGRFRDGLLLVNSTHGYKWYERIYREFPVCLLTERLRFLRLENPEKPGLRKGESWFDRKLGLIRSNQAKRGQSLVLFSQEVCRFQDEFSHMGRIILPENNSK